MRVVDSARKWLAAACLDALQDVRVEDPLLVRVRADDAQYASGAPRLQERCLNVMPNSEDQTASALQG